MVYMYSIRIYKLLRGLYNRFTPELLEPFKLFQTLQSLPNTLNKLNTSKVSDCPGSYMSKGVCFKN